MKMPFDKSEKGYGSGKLTATYIEHKRMKISYNLTKRKILDLWSHAKELYRYFWNIYLCALECATYIHRAEELKLNIALSFGM